MLKPRTVLLLLMVCLLVFFSDGEDEGKIIFGEGGEGEQSYSFTHSHTDQFFSLIGVSKLKIIE